MTERLTKRLTDAFVRKAPAGKHYDDWFGLYLHVRKTGSRQWVWRGAIRGRGARRVELGLGGYPLRSLAEARELAFSYSKSARDGVDPRVNRVSTVPTFAEAIEKTLDNYRGRWKDGSTSEKSWRRTLTKHAAPLGPMPVDAITTADVQAVLLPIWHTKSKTAGMARQRIFAVLNQAIADGHRDDNPAGEALLAVLPKHKPQKKNMAALPHAEVANALRTVRESGYWHGTRLLIDFTVLTAVRSQEARGARWEEVDREAKVWTVPAARTKTGREHRVPLSSAALAVLDRLNRRGELVFPSRRGGPIHASTPSKVLRDLFGKGPDGKAKVTLHGFRSTFRDWFAEIERAPREVAEAALAHTVPGVEGAYKRTDFLERRRPVMEHWGAYCHPA